MFFSVVVLHALLWNFEEMYYFSIEMLIMSAMEVINMSSQIFNTLVGIGSRSHDFDDELKIGFLISSSDARSETFILDLISGFCTCGIFVLYLEISNG